jgi:flavin reductase (DIM6/NTAB) family NADH-FMN oxidoreductase RutF
MVYGMYLLTAREGEQDFGCLVNTAIQVSSQPDRIAVCVVKSNLTHEVLQRTGVFNLSGLQEEAPMELFRNFGMRSSRKTDKFTQFPGLARSANGILFPSDWGTMCLSAEVTEQVDLGDHTLFIGRITDDAVLHESPTCSYRHFCKHILPRSKTGD